MTGSMFEQDGSLRIPEPVRVRKTAPGESVVVNAAYCPDGHNLVSLEHRLGGFPAIVLRFEGSAGSGLVALSAVLGDPGREILEGALPEDEAVMLHCPVCGVPLDVLGECRCTPGAVTVLAYLYPERDPYQAIAFCSSLTCDNSAVIRSGEAIKAHTETPWQG